MATAVPIDMVELQNTIHRWVSESTDLVTVWEQQSSPRPNYSYASLNIIAGPTPSSSNWDVSHEYNQNGIQGEELDFNAGVPCMFTVSVKVFVNRPSSSNPSTASQQYLLRALAELQNDSRINLMQSKSVSFVRSEALNSFAEIRNDGFIGLAGMDFIFQSVMNSQWYATYIERVRMSSSLGGNFEVDISVPLVVVDQLGGNIVVDGIGSTVVA